MECLGTISSKEKAHDMEKVPGRFTLQQGRRCPGLSPDFGWCALCLIFFHVLQCYKNFPTSKPCLVAMSVYGKNQGMNRIRKK